MSAVSFHFHGYQPGDIVRWLEPDPLKSQTFEERRSPVALRVGSDRIAGKNWTDAVLRTYGRLQSVLDRAEGAAAVDIEPQTLVWLLERDPEAYRRTLASYENGGLGLVLTPPFHPILPHTHTIERHALFDLMLDFYSPLLRRVGEGSVGLWLPEAGYSKQTIVDYFETARRAMVEIDGLPDLAGGTYLLLDARQLSRSVEGQTAWATLNLDRGVPVIAREIGLSADFAFGATPPSDFSAEVRDRKADSVLVSSDLESLLANPAQAERFQSIVASLRGEGFNVAPPSPPETRPAADAIEFSSWSDYDEHLHGGHTSDSRWTGLRRSDGLVVSRPHLGGPLSQLWKHAFTVAGERVETSIRRAARDVLKEQGVKRPTDALRRLAIAYGRHLFAGHYRRNGYPSSEVEFPLAAETILRGKIDVEAAGFLARGYVMMLMGLRSDPRFWDGPDTRVTFQNIALLSQALVDSAQACSRTGDPSRADRLLRLLRTTLLEFAEMHGRGEFASLQGVEGWETTDGAWHRSLQSEVPQRSALDVVQRAALYSVGERGSRGEGAGRRIAGVVADTGHILGEAHGEWENREWCEHRLE